MALLLDAGSHYEVIDMFHRSLEPITNSLTCYADFWFPVRSHWHVSRIYGFQYEVDIFRGSLDLITKSVTFLDPSTKSLTCFADLWIPVRSRHVSRIFGSHYEVTDISGSQYEVIDMFRGFLDSSTESDMFRGFVDPSTKSLTCFADLWIPVRSRWHVSRIFGSRYEVIDMFRGFLNPIKKSLTCFAGLWIPIRSHLNVFRIFWSQYEDIDMFRGYLVPNTKTVLRLFSRLLGHRNCGRFEQTEVAVSLRKFYRILSPWKLQDYGCFI